MISRWRSASPIECDGRAADLASSRCNSCVPTLSRRRQAVHRIRGDVYVVARVTSTYCYTLTLTPRGHRYGAEREPNNDSTRARPILLDQQITGRLPGWSDVDVYRFSLTAVEHVRLGLAPPPDGAIVASLVLGSGMTVAGQTDQVIERAGPMTRCSSRGTMSCGSGPRRRASHRIGCVSNAKTPSRSGRTRSRTTRPRSPGRCRHR